METTNLIQFDLTKKRLDQISDFMPSNLVSMLIKGILGIEGKTEIKQIDKDNFVICEQNKKEKNLLKGLEGIVLKQAYTMILNKIKKEITFDIDLIFNMVNSSEVFVIVENKKPFLLIDFKDSFIEYEFLNIYFSQNGYGFKFSDENSKLLIQINM